MSDQKEISKTPSQPIERANSQEDQYNAYRVGGRPSLPIPISRLVGKNPPQANNTSLTKITNSLTHSTNVKKSGFSFRGNSPVTKPSRFKFLAETMKKEDEKVEDQFAEEEGRDKRCMIDFHVKSNKTQLPNLINVYAILLKVFFNLPVEIEDLELKKSELYLIKEIILRKCKHPPKYKNLAQKTSSVSVAEITEILEYLEQYNSTKRVEENIKFIFKLTLKRLKKDYQLRQSNMASDRKLALEDFYGFYFGEFVDTWGLDLQQFTEPLRKKTYQKKLNHEYITRIFASKPFKVDFLKHINSGEFKREYQGTIPNKVLKLLSRFDRLFAGEDQQKAVEQVSKYFKGNKQCKLPWTEKEIINSINDFNSLCSRLGI